jgi:hypothetical protein
VLGNACIAEACADIAGLMGLGEPCGDGPIFGHSAQVEREYRDAGGCECRVEGAFGGGGNGEGMHAGFGGHIDGPERALVEGKAKIHDLRAEKIAQVAAQGMPVRVRPGDMSVVSPHNNLRAGIVIGDPANVLGHALVAEIAGRVRVALVLDNLHMRELLDDGCVLDGPVCVAGAGSGCNKSTAVCGEVVDNGLAIRVNRRGIDRRLGVLAAKTLSTCMGDGFINGDGIAGGGEDSAAGALTAGLEAAKGGDSKSKSKADGSR